LTAKLALFSPVKGDTKHQSSGHPCFGDTADL